MAKPTFCYRLVQRVHVAVHGLLSPTGEEWRSYVADIGSRLDRIDAIYSFTEGGGPDGGQRKEAVDFWSRQQKRPPIAVVTPSMLVVRMSGALRWFMPTQIKAFRPRDVTEAFEYLRLDDGQRRAVLQAVNELRDLLADASIGAKRQA